MTPKDFAIEYFEEDNDDMFPLISPEQWLEFAAQYAEKESKETGRNILSIFEGMLPTVKVAFFIIGTIVGAVLCMAIFLLVKR